MTLCSLLSCISSSFYDHRVSTDYVDHFYHLIMTQLNQEHAEIRLSAFQMVSEIFNRSHHFRDLLITNFQEFLELTVETDTEQPLPPPKEVARKLKTLAIQTVQSWHATYGEAYKKLSLGYHFLKQIKKVFIWTCLFCDYQSSISLHPGTRHFCYVIM